MRYTIKVNGSEHTVEVEPATPLLWVLREHLGLTGTKYGCGIARCGACTIHVEGVAAFACVVPVSSVSGRAITTIEGLSDGGEHPLQRAWIAEQVPQCGYCQSGMIMRAAELLKKKPDPTRDDIVSGIPNLCRCGTYPRIIRAVQRAASEAKA